MTSQADVYVDLENQNNEDTCCKACKTECYKCTVDLGNLVIPVCIVFSSFALCMYIIIKFYH